jgi:HSP20 family protein
MTYASTYDPSHYAHLADVFPRLFKSLFDEPGTAQPVRRRQPGLAAAFAVDVHEDEAAYTLVGNLPGFSKDDIKVEIDGNQVNIRAENTPAAEQDDTGTTTQASQAPPVAGTTPHAKVLRNERYSGAFARGFSLPVEIDDARSQAKYENGVLTLTLPKKPQASAKRVNIA